MRELLTSPIQQRDTEFHGWRRSYFTHSSPVISLWALSVSMPPEGGTLVLQQQLCSIRALSVLHKSCGWAALEQSARGMREVLEQSGSCMRAVLERSGSSISCVFEWEHRGVHQSVEDGPRGYIQFFLVHALGLVLDVLGSFLVDALLKVFIGALGFVVFMFLVLF